MIVKSEEVLAWLNTTTAERFNSPPYDELRARITDGTSTHDDIRAVMGWFESDAEIDRTVGLMGETRAEYLRMAARNFGVEVA